MKRYCPKCDGSMTEGFVIDRDQNHGNKVARWVEGPPDKRWYGIRMRGKAQYDVVTWRCSRCFYLESYAAE